MSNIKPIGKLIISAVHGGYSSWSDWSECSVTCEEGLRSRSRSCDSPVPANGGRPCIGMNSETKICDMHHCPGKGLVFLNEVYTERNGM